MKVVNKFISSHIDLNVDKSPFVYKRASVSICLCDKLYVFMRQLVACKSKRKHLHYTLHMFDHERSCRNKSILNR